MKTENEDEKEVKEKAADFAATLAAFSSNLHKKIWARKGRIAAGEVVPEPILVDVIKNSPWESPVPGILCAAAAVFTKISKDKAEEVYGLPRDEMAVLVVAMQVTAGQLIDDANKHFFANAVDAAPDEEKEKGVH